MMLLLAVTAMMATPALAAEYEFADSDGPMYAPSTSVDQVIVVGGGVTESSNIDRSKNTAVLAPPFGSPESYLPGAGTAVIPQSNTSTSSTISGDTIYVPPAAYDDSTPSQDTSVSSNKFTLPDGLFYEDGSLGRLKIPTLGLSVKVYEDESLESLAKGAGHFKSTSCWDGNVGIAGHNRGVTNHFGQIHTLEKGDRITYTTKLGTRTYEVFFVGKIEETDFSRLGRSSENLITLITCVRNVPELRWCVHGNVKKCAVGKHPKSEKHSNTAQFSEVERSGTQENCGGIGSGCRLRLRPLPVLRRRQSQRVARIDPNAVVVDKNIAENDRFDLFSR